MAGIKESGENDSQGGGNDGKKRRPARPPAILPHPLRKKREEVVDQTEEIDKHREYDKIKHNARVEGPYGADGLFEYGGLSPLQAVPNEKCVRKREVEDDYGDAENARPGQRFPAPPEQIDISRQVENIRDLEEHRGQSFKLKKFYDFLTVLQAMRCSSQRTIPGKTLSTA